MAPAFTGEEYAAIQRHDAATVRGTGIDRRLDRNRVVGQAIPYGSVGQRIARIETVSTDNADPGSHEQRHGEERSCPGFAKHGDSCQQKRFQGRRSHDFIHERFLH
jgi:hypothetical protein